MSVVQSLLEVLTDAAASSISVFAVADGVNVQFVLFLNSEPYSIVSDPKSQVIRISLKFLDIAFAAVGKTQQRGENAHRGLPVQTPHVCSGAF
ncbi:MAG: hypothetical protein WBL50_10615 [Candidatus Acidiferrum sp.]